MFSETDFTQLTSVGHEVCIALVKSALCLYFFFFRDPLSANPETLITRKWMSGPLISGLCGVYCSFYIIKEVLHSLPAGHDSSIGLFGLFLNMFNGASSPMFIANLHFFWPIKPVEGLRSGG